MVGVEIRGEREKSRRGVWYDWEYVGDGMGELISVGVFGGVLIGDGLA